MKKWSNSSDTNWNARHAFLRLWGLWSLTKIHVIEDALSESVVKKGLKPGVAELHSCSNNLRRLGSISVRLQTAYCSQKFEKWWNSSWLDSWWHVPMRAQSALLGKWLEIIWHYRNLRTTNPLLPLCLWLLVIVMVPVRKFWFLSKITIVTTNPIAGTTKRSTDEEEDKALATDLLSDEGKQSIGCCRLGGVVLAAASVQSH